MYRIWSKGTVRLAPTTHRERAHLLTSAQRRALGLDTPPPRPPPSTPSTKGGGGTLQSSFPAATLPSLRGSLARACWDARPAYAALSAAASDSLAHLAISRSCEDAGRTNVFQRRRGDLIGGGIGSIWDRDGFHATDTSNSCGQAPIKNTEIKHSCLRFSFKIPYVSETRSLSGENLISSKYFPQMNRLGGCVL